MSRPDNNYVSFAHMRPMGLREAGNVVPPTDTHDTIKITDCDNGEFHAERVVGGIEDCADLNNRCRKIIVGTHETIWEPRGKYVFTCKGGCEDIEFRGIIRGRGKEVDIDLGNLSEQSSERTRNIFLNVRSEDGSPITWRRINSNTPTFRAGQKFKKVWSVPGELRAAWVWFYSQLKKVFKGL